jgi:hypothetical protein
MPRVSYNTEGNTRASVKGKDVKVRRSRQAVARRKRYVENLGSPRDSCWWERSQQGIRIFRHGTGKPRNRLRRNLKGDMENQKGRKVIP